MNKNIKLSILIKMVNNQFEMELNKKCALLNLTHAQCRILGFLNLNKNEEVYLNDIEKRFCLKRPTVTGLIKRLEEKGFISVVPKENDRRYKRVILTEKSEEVLEAMQKNVDDTEKVLCRNISESEKTEFLRILTIMFNNMRRNTI